MDNFAQCVVNDFGICFTTWRTGGTIAYDVTIFDDTEVYS